MKWGFLSLFSRFSLHFPTLLFNSSTWLIWYADTHRIHKHWTSYKYLYPYEYLSLSCKPGVYIIKLILPQSKRKKESFYHWSNHFAVIVCLDNNRMGRRRFLFHLWTPLFPHIKISWYKAQGGLDLCFPKDMSIKIIFKVLSVSTRHYNSQIDILVI